VEEDEDEKPGDTYVGYMSHGKREGVGKYTWSSGAVFEGTYLNNKKQGQGVMLFPDKGNYEGMFIKHGSARNGKLASDVCQWRRLP
jgi:hypothetical protein